MSKYLNARNSRRHLLVSTVDLKRQETFLRIFNQSISLSRRGTKC